MELSFLGATGTVTGSKYLLNHAGRNVLIDCGLFQGFKQLRLRNWASLPVAERDIDTVVLTHAHIDHSGYLPVLVKNGFRGKVYCSAATADLCEILLPDSGHLQEEEADYANRHGFSKHHPALPLYTMEDAERALRHLAPVDEGQALDLGKGLHASLLRAGHILGSSMVKLQDAGMSVLFTGDLGRPADPVMYPPAEIHEIDYLILESTYGDRRHVQEDPQEALAKIINRTVERGGVMIIPAFAVARAQTLLYHIHRLKMSQAIPDIPVYLNSPMAVDVTRVFHRHHVEHRLSEEECAAACHTAHFINSVEESKWLNSQRDPMIIISASGMATGGRVLHHLKTFAPDPRNTVLFTGFQAGGTRGAAMIAGAESVKIHGSYIPIRAEVDVLNNLSAHADYEETLDWLSQFRSAPRRVFLTHGEPNAADALRQRIAERLGWAVDVPDYREHVRLSG